MKKTIRNLRYSDSLILLNLTYFLVSIISFVLLAVTPYLPFNILFSESVWETIAKYSFGVLLLNSVIFSVAAVFLKINPWDEKAVKEKSELLLLKDLSSHETKKLITKLEEKLRSMNDEERKSNEEITKLMQKIRE